jgi:hypothetical protein
VGTHQALKAPYSVKFGVEFIVYRERGVELFDTKIDRRNELHYGRTCYHPDIPPVLFVLLTVVEFGAFFC